MGFGVFVVCGGYVWWFVLLFSGFGFVCGYLCFFVSLLFGLLTGYGVLGFCDFVVIACVLD